MLYAGQIVPGTDESDADEIPVSRLQIHAGVERSHRRYLDQHAHAGHIAARGHRRRRAVCRFHRATQRGQGTVTRNYFAAFRENLAKATLLWLIFGICGAAIAYSWIVLQITPLLIPKFALTIIWAIGFEWAFYLQARFENPLGQTLRNAYVFGVVYFPATLACVAIDVVFVGLLVAAWFYMPQGLFLLVVLGYGCMLALHVPILEYALRRYTRQ